MKIFDLLSAEYSFYPETKNNIHYYNGWCTNKAHKINKKVIIPTFENLFDVYSWVKLSFKVHEAYELLRDIEKVCNYFNVNSYNLDMYTQLNNASESGVTRNIHLTYFDVTLYKKGTIHITFTNEEALNKLNIYGSKLKGWLPPSYGKKHYREMSDEEKAVIDDFQGEYSYEKELENPSLVFGEGESSLLKIA